MATETKELEVIDLNPKQEEFAKLYASDKEFFGNGVQAYIEAYEPDMSRKGWYNSACASASQLLSNIKVLKRIDQLLELRGLNDAFVDKQLELLITQNADYKTKVAAIKEYNTLKARTSKADRPTLNQYNTFIQQNNVNPNTVEAKELVSSTLEMLMQKTKRS